MPQRDHGLAGQNALQSKGVVYRDHGIAAVEQLPIVEVGAE